MIFQNTVSSIWLSAQDLLGVQLFLSFTCDEKGRGTNSFQIDPKAYCWNIKYQVLIKIFEVSANSKTRGS